MSVADSYNGYAARTLGNDGTDPTSPILYDGVDTYTPGLGEQASNGSTYGYEVGGALGTTDGMLTVSNGNTQNWGAEYDAFGNQLSVTVTPGFLPGPGLMEAFGGAQGYQTDSDTGLVRCGNRYYWPLFGRWLTEDPAGVGDNWYGYCENSPVGSADPTGKYGPEEQKDSMGLPMTDDTMLQGLWHQAMDFVARGIDHINGMGDATDFLIGFLTGTGTTENTYTDSDTQTKELENSRSFEQVLSDIANGKTRGAIKTVPAFTDSVKDIWNSTEWQLGAYSWLVKGNLLILKNIASFNSLFYHIPQGFNSLVSSFGSVPSFLHAPATWYRMQNGFGPLGNVRQTFIIHYKKLM